MSSREVAKRQAGGAGKFVVCSTRDCMRQIFHFPWGVGMWMFSKRLAPIAAGILLLLPGSQPPSFARGSQVVHDDPWNPEHIDRLPPEVRDAIIRMCGDPPRAGHYFATYFDHSRLMKLHFEDLHCDRRAFCRGDACLQQEYISSKGHFRLIRSYYAHTSE